MVHIYTKPNVCERYDNPVENYTAKIIIAEFLRLQHKVYELLVAFMANNKRS